MYNIEEVALLLQLFISNLRFKMSIATAVLAQQKIAEIVSEQNGTKIIPVDHQHNDNLETCFVSFIEPGPETVTFAAYAELDYLSQKICIETGAGVHIEAGLINNLSNYLTGAVVIRVNWFDNPLSIDKNTPGAQNFFELRLH